MLTKNKILLLLQPKQIILAHKVNKMRYNFLGYSISLNARHIFVGICMITHFAYIKLSTQLETKKLNILETFQQCYLSNKKLCWLINFIVVLNVTHFIVFAHYEIEYHRDEPLFLFSFLIFSWPNINIKGPSLLWYYRDILNYLTNEQFDRNFLKKTY